MVQYSAMQELYDALFAYCQKFNVGVYDTLPGSSATYPFITLDSTQVVVDAYKRGEVPHDIITLQIFATRDQRKQLNQIVDSLATLRNVTTAHFAYFARLDDNTVTTRQEDADNETLLHATLSLHFVAYHQNNKSTSYFK